MRASESNRGSRRRAVLGSADRLRQGDGPPTPHAKVEGLRHIRRRDGYTFVELLVVSVILLVLASAVLPLARVTIQRQREIELRRSLREMRDAIDRFKDAADLQMIAATDLKAGAEGYPEKLEILVEGVKVTGDASGKKLKFLRRIPIDPMTKSNEWGMRSYQDDADSTSWGGQNVFDVYTKSEGTGLDGTKYRTW